MSVIQRAIAELTAKKLNASKFDTRSLIKDILQKNKWFTKSYEKLRNVAKSIPRTQTTSQSIAYEAHLCDPSNGSQIKCTDHTHNIFG